jgi:hypothetical protein
VKQLVAEPPEGSDGDVPPLVAHACDLDRALVSRYQKLACVREFHEPLQPP